MNYLSNRLIRYFLYLIWQKFDKLLAKGKNIVQLTEICSKYETEREQVQPFRLQNIVVSPEQVADQNTEILKDFKEVWQLCFPRIEHFFKIDLISSSI